MSKMKLAVSYNLFDTEELLEASIATIREEVDYINVVYQTVSNTGKPCSKELISTVKELENQGFIDELILYTPNFDIQPHDNELKKRNIGLKFAKKNKCTHFLSLDSDEFYNNEQLAIAKKTIIENQIDYTAVRLTNYFKSAIYEMNYHNQPDYFVSFIFKIKRFHKFELNIHFPVLVDPTRRIKGRKFLLFDKNTIQMHHMTLVRKNIRSKLESSSSNHVYIKNNIEDYVTYFNNWEYGQDAYPPSNYNNIVSIKVVPNQFNIHL